MLNEYLGIKNEGAKPVIFCSACGHIFGPADENYKLHALVREGPVSEAGPQVDPYKRSKKYKFRQFACPGCHRLLDSQIVLKDAPIEWDVRVTC